MKRRPRGRNLVVDINVTPLTDVVAVLLVIFIVATPLIYQSSIQVRLPKTATAQKPPRSVAVTVDAKGAVFLEKRRFTLPADAAALGARLAEVAGKEGGGSSIVINGDRDVRYDSIVKVIDASLQAGITRIILATEHEKGKAKRK